MNLNSAGLEAHCALGISSLPAELQVTFFLQLHCSVCVVSSTQTRKQHQHNNNNNNSRDTDRLTAITTVSSSLNLGMYLSPRVISASFSGLKRHITLTPHSDASIMSAGLLLLTQMQTNK